MQYDNAKFSQVSREIGTVLWGILFNFECQTAAWFGGLNCSVDFLYKNHLLFTG